MDDPDLRLTEKLATKKLERSSYDYQVRLRCAGHHRLLVNLQNDRFYDRSPPVQFWVDEGRNPRPTEIAGRIAAKAPHAIDAQARSLLLEESG